MPSKSSKPANGDKDGPEKDDINTAEPVEERLHVVLIDPTQLKPHPNNPRLHPDGSLIALMKSMEKYGWTEPILISKNNLIIAGHARWKTAMRRGMLQVPCIQLPLEGALLDAYLIADNRTKYNSRFSTAALKHIVAEFKESGYDTKNLFLDEKTMKKIDLGEDINPGKADPSGLITAVAETIQINVSQPGDEPTMPEDAPMGGGPGNGMGSEGGPLGGDPIGYLKDGRLICPFCGLELTVDENGNVFECQGNGGDMEPEVEEEEEEEEEGEQ